MGKGVSITFPPGTLVTLRTDVEKRVRIVSRVALDEDGLEYGLRCGADDTTWHKTSEMQDYKEERPITPGFRVPEPTKTRRKR